MSAVEEENWQTVRPTIRERFSYLFNNELLSDVNFEVEMSLDGNDGDDCFELGSKKCKMAIPAHKLVLASGSPVFFAMFYSKLAEKSDSIKMQDCEYESLLELFHFLYSDEVDLTPDNVMQVLYLAKKYIVPALVDKCNEYLGEHLDSSNVFTVMDCARSYDEKKLMGQCWCAVDKFAAEAVRSSGFTTIEKSVLEVLVERDTLKIKEVDLFKAVDEWASKECERKGVQTDGTMKRKILGERIVKAIRFPVMEQKEFVAAVLDSNVLTPKEVYDIMKYYNSVQLTSPLGFPDTERIGNAYQCCRFRTAKENGWFYDSILQDGLVFSISKPIRLYGISLFGSKNNQYAVNLKICRYPKLSTNEPTNSVRELACKTGTFSSAKMESKSFTYYGFNVLFDEPVVIVHSISHCVVALISGPEPSWCGESGNNSVQCSGVTFNFKNYLQGENGTSPKLGQFPQFLFTITK